MPQVKTYLIRYTVGGDNNVVEGTEIAVDILFALATFDNILRSQWNTYEILSIAIKG